MGFTSTPFARRVSRGTHRTTCRALLLLCLAAVAVSPAPAESRLVLRNEEVVLHASAACPDPDPNAPSPARTRVDPSTVVPGRVLVALRQEPPTGPLVAGRDADGCAVTGIPALDESSHMLGIRRVEMPFRREKRGMLQRIAVLTIDENVDPRRAAEVLAAGSGVLWAEPDHLRRLDAVPSDASWSLQWNMQQVDAPGAWDLETGDSQVVLAVIDSGLQLSHPELASQLWTNQGEDGGIPGFDDDGNGFIDDFVGWDFVDASPFQVAQGEDPGPPDNLPLDHLGHGTAVAGVAGAAANNAVPWPSGSNVAGACWGCRLMALRAGYQDAATGAGVVPASASAAAIVYAADNGADIINMSYSSPALSLAEEAAVAHAVAAGVLPVAAAGNIRDPNRADEIVYPAALPGVLAVAATDRFDSKALFSKYGTYVDLAAPGLQIFTTGLTASAPHHFLDGTSFSAPLVAGIAGLVLSNRIGLEGADLEAVMLASAVNIDSRNLPYAGMLGEGRVDALGAVAAHSIAVTNDVIDAGSPSSSFSITGLQPDASAPWLEFSFQPPVTVAPGEIVFLDASVHVEEAGCGWSHAQVTLLTDDPDLSSVDIPVRLRLDCDRDNDGFDCQDRGGADCDDDDAGISPGVEEICNGSLICLGLPAVDENCDGRSDEICSCTGKPNAPELLSAEAVPGTGVRLVWKDLSNNERGFKIHKRKRPKGKWRKVVKLLDDAQGYLDTDVEHRQRYQYRIKAFKKGGKGNKVFTDVIYFP